MKLAIVRSIQTIFYLLVFMTTATQSKFSFLKLIILILLPLCSAAAQESETTQIGPLEKLLKSGRLDIGELPEVKLNHDLSPDYLALFSSEEESKKAIVWLISHRKDYDYDKISAEHVRNFILTHYPMGRDKRNNFDLIVYMPRPETKELAALGLLLEIKELIPPPSQIKSKEEVALPGHTASMVFVRDGRCFLEIPSSQETLIFLHANQCSDPAELVESARTLNLSRFKAKLTY